jgi:hypothetical protein
MHTCTTVLATRPLGTTGMHMTRVGVGIEKTWTVSSPIRPPTLAAREWLAA